MILKNAFRRTRPGLTLVEMMVGTAVSLTIMVILTESFKMGLDFTRYAHSVGEMTTQLGGTGQVMARDLHAEHFLPDDTRPGRGVRLSDQRLDLLGTGAGWTPPRGGFVRIISPQPVFETYDGDSFTINSAYNHALQFTAILAGGTDANLYTANVGGATFSSRAAEIAYFLVDSGQRTSSGRVLFNLVRRQRLVAYSNDDRAALTPTLPTLPDSDVIAASGGTIFTLADLTNPANRLGVAPGAIPGAIGSPLGFAPTNIRYGEDILLSNVLSFEVQADWTAGNVPGSRLYPRSFQGDQPSPNPSATALADRNPLAAANTAGLANTDSPCDYLSLVGRNNTLPGVFDTWYPVTPPGPRKAWYDFSSSHQDALPLAVRVNAIQITIRVFDPKVKTARQNTWKFSM